MIYVENEMIGKRLRQFRIRLGMDFMDMAEILGVSEGHYRKIERGVYGLDVRKVLILYQKLKLDPLYLLTGKQETEKNPGLNESQSDRNELVCELLDYCRKQLGSRPSDRTGE